MRREEEEEKTFSDDLLMDRLARVGVELEWECVTLTSSTEKERLVVATEGAEEMFAEALDGEDVPGTGEAPGRVVRLRRADAEEADAAKDESVRRRESRAGSVRSAKRRTALRHMRTAVMFLFSNKSTVSKRSLSERPS